MILILLALYLYYSSGYYIGKITKSEIEMELDYSFQHSADLLEHDTYGWAEEWGEKLLFKLSYEDCEAISSKLTTRLSYSSGAAYHQLFLKQNLGPNSLFSRTFSDPNGNFRQYMLDRDSCVLYRRNHIE